MTNVRRLLLLQLPLVVLWTVAFLICDCGDNGKLESHFLRSSIYPSLRRLENTYTDLKFRARGPEPVGKTVKHSQGTMSLRGHV